MPDIPFFDATGYFQQKITETEQVLIGKKAEREILAANRVHLEQTLATLGMLSSEHQRAIQTEVANLKEILNTCDRTIGTLDGEIEALSAKLAALQTAQTMLQVGESQ
jgi:chromosome segregation ATPase